METTLYIKNMVCGRCQRVVREELEALGMPVSEVQLGQVTVALPEAQIDKAQVKKALRQSGFELINNRQARLIEQIKTAIIQLVHQPEHLLLSVNLSDYLAEVLQQEYHLLSTLFSATEGFTIERFYILQKVERVKELLVYDELSLKEIAYRLGYSSPAHLSNQFKKITGLTPSYFKSIGGVKRSALDQIGRSSPSQK
ncbi:AraC-type DNA-binding protein [Catalinimonas alkaloidigena]|uniref:AraC-type DNA-binding protein n=1 Tax=Catalinimonas alkaloidigena TaxID=1075417 RepID=A0A1G9VMR1_9BACT|nr:AraC family transcriptional regulator [Catalinimonas alkaloidigena]SDM73532.1 AraC-type DNA-binding protein [Catalinimonas alkaloidigena]